MSENYVEMTGGCLCGAVRYEAEVNLNDAFYCHCKICQKLSGTPAGIDAFVKPGTMKFTRGNPKFFQSSPFAKRGFCAECGSRLFWAAPEKPDWDNVPIGSLDHPEKVVPSEHICAESQLSWYKANEDLPHNRSNDNPDLVGLWAKAGMSHDGQLI